MQFIDEIMGWYQQNKRDLPWRNTSDPYVIWLSEIILQQTRVEQGMPYFNRFLEKYPAVSDFASAAENDILNLWQGLGYYSRGRNMHATAKFVMENYQGIFPTRYDDLILLKGIGEYTAAAISSFSVNEPRAVVDGNVFRLLSRYFGIKEVINSPKGKKIFTQLANEVMNKEQPGLSNQAMMEFGSLVCKPKAPDCVICPVNQDCYALKQGEIGNLPVKKKGGISRSRYFNYVVVLKDNAVLMNKRGPKDIWENLYDFPLFETDTALDANAVLALPEFVEIFGAEVRIESVHRSAKHLLSHQTIYAQFIVIQYFNLAPVQKVNWSYIRFEDLEKIAQPKIIFSFLRNLVP
ncbi:A/G-specific adenine glycosylase [Arcticibacter eurypsychrophilus]|uniref:A/G-specific adenine glycosylase n=1 Tax=Arcticibacter eurypsychrophilus TaxID=1434752 RepID=UPI00084D0981|nr:A/G-specific adenine glycosylase [Arcticibacter eurypsychrophilus]